MICRCGLISDQVQLIEVNGCLAVDPGVGLPENDFSGLRVDQPPLPVVSLVRQLGGDLPEVKAAQIKHRASVIPCTGRGPRQKRAGSRDAIRRAGAY